MTRRRGPGIRVALLSLGVTAGTAMANAAGMKYLTVRVGEVGLASVSATVGLGAPVAAIATAPVLRHLPAVRSRAIDIPQMLRDMAIWGAASFAILGAIGGAMLDTSRLDWAVVALSGLILCIGLAVTGLATALATILEDRRWVTSQLVLAFGQLGVLLTMVTAAPTGTISMLATALGTLPALGYSAWLISHIARVETRDEMNAAATRPPIVATANVGLVILAGVAGFSVRYAVGYADLTAAAHLQVALAVSGLVAAGIGRYVQVAVFPSALGRGNSADVAIKGLSVVFAGGLLFTGIFLFEGHQIVTLLFDADTADAAPLTSWLIAAEVVYGLASVFTTIAFSHSRHRSWFVGSGLYFGIRVVGIFLWILLVGVVTTDAIAAVNVGAAITSLAACVLLWIRPRSVGSTAAMISR